MSATFAERARAVVTPGVIEAYRRDGAVVLRGILDSSEVATLQRGIDAVHVHQVGQVLRLGFAQAQHHGVLRGLADALLRLAVACAHQAFQRQGPFPGRLGIAGRPDRIP